MSLTSSLYTGTSGLTNMGNSMQVIGDNISNVNTVGFKGNRSLFADLLNQSISTQSGASQVGRGTAIQIVDTSFQQGSFESTGNTTDLSIGGNGFFQLRDKNSEEVYYTRAGNFSFDKDGKLINPDGHIVQGWALDEETGNDIGAIKDIILDSFTSPPKKTDKVNMVTNLDADATSKSIVLANAWNASKENFMPPNNYEYQSVVKVYDSLGSTHDITIYYDKKSGSKWEYLVTCNPDEDSRNLVQGTEAKGLLARGEIEFNESDGSVADMTMERFTGRIGNIRSYGVNQEEDITFRISNYDAMDYDGFNFHLEYDGNQWSFQDSSGPAGIPDGIIDANDKPSNYPNAQIMTTSNEKKIEIRFNPDPTELNPEPDMVIYLDNDAAATDSLHFDVNRSLDIHKQEVTGLTYKGDTDNDNSTLYVNDPSVMVRDLADLNLVWDPINENWYMSYPTSEGIITSNQGVLAVGGTTLDAASSLTVNNASLLKYNTGTLNVGYDTNVKTSNNQWYWKDAVHYVGGTGDITSAPTLTYNDQTVFTKASKQNYTLNYDGSGGWSFSNLDIVKADYPNVQILTGSSNANQVQVDFDGDGLSDITYDFGGTELDAANSLTLTSGTIPTSVSNASATYDGTSWSLSSSISSAYPNATITTVDASNFSIDLDGTGTNVVTVSLNDATPAAVAAASGDTVTFNLTGANTAALQTANPVGSGFMVGNSLDTTGVKPSSFTFRVDPFPNHEYPGAEITTTDASNFSVDFNRDSSADMTFSLNDGTAAVAAAAGDTLTFNVDPRATPEDYPDAVVKGDKDSVYVDLDGSGGEDDTKDIVFEFTESLGTGADAGNSLINFDIVGGTSWNAIDKKDITTEGYFSFMADFLGATGEFGPNTFETTEQEILFDIGTIYNGISFEKSSLATTQYAKPSSTTFQSANGYGAGDLEGVNVSGDGTITGVYSNGQQIPLYRVALAKFLSDQGLYKEGGNLYRETRSSGDAITGRPGENGLGNISPNSLEMSNVDIADEFVSMITTQRGFQANSKIVTTVDDMLSEVINMKR